MENRKRDSHTSLSRMAAHSVTWNSLAALFGLQGCQVQSQVKQPDLNGGPMELLFQQNTPASVVQALRL